MASRDRLDIAFVVLITLAFAALTSTASNNDSFTGTLLVPDRQWSATHSSSKYILDDEEDGDLYALEGQDQKLGAFAGQKVTIIGTISEDTIHVSSVYVAKETPAKSSSSTSRPVAQLASAKLVGRR